MKVNKNIRNVRVRSLSFNAVTCSRTGMLPWVTVTDEFHVTSYQGKIKRTRASFMLAHNIIWQFEGLQRKETLHFTSPGSYCLHSHCHECVRLETLIKEKKGLSFSLITTAVFHPVIQWFIQYLIVRSAAIVKMLFCCNFKFNWYLLLFLYLISFFYLFIFLNFSCSSLLCSDLLPLIFKNGNKWTFFKKISLILVKTQNSYSRNWNILHISLFRRALTQFQEIIQKQLD